MNLKHWRMVGLATVIWFAGLAARGENYEYAMIKWDGPDKLAMIYPDKAEVVRVFKLSKLPADVNEEEFCLTWGANRLAKEGWEPVNMDSRRILFRRAPKN
ncbi:MAG TPA: hypothetical protein VJ063_11605 [Verrucomicrobiae bacterium]|nr:hypothetical protein [Verrucomicrobiae bacterium]